MSVTELNYTDFPKGIPVSLWGRDHITTLLYAETRAVDHRGNLSEQQMRTSRDYPTRLRRVAGDEASTVVVGHTDYDCLKDAQAVGFIEADWEEPLPVKFTDAGWAFVHGLRRSRAEGRPSQEGVVS